jgi:3-hydroxymyristoyl/3-hydroxydecanoyl-(acyl carrier protein) dehydratase
MAPPAIAPPIVLLLIVAATPVVVLTRMPLNPVVVPVLCIVIAPILLLEILVAWKLKLKKPRIGTVFAVTDVRFRTMVDEPSRLPIVLPVALIRPSVVPIATAIKAEVEVDVELLLDVWSMPDMVLF